MVLSREEVRRVLREMTGINGLLARLMYGTGMRAMESLQLRVKDVMALPARLNILLPPLLRRPVRRRGAALI